GPGFLRKAGRGRVSSGDGREPAGRLLPGRRRRRKDRRAARPPSGQRPAWSDGARIPSTSARAPGNDVGRTRYADRSAPSISTPVVEAMRKAGETTARRP